MEKKHKTNPFKVPKGYFDDFNERLSDKLPVDNNIIPEKDGFTIPEGYFEALNKNLHTKLEEPETKVIALKPFKRYYYVAASIAAIVLVALNFNWSTSQEIGFEDLANTEIETYFENNDLELSSYEIAEVLPVDQLEVNDILDKSFKEENIFDYLNENIDDFEVLTLEEDE